MGRVKELAFDFEDIQKELLKHKYLYYVKAAPIISDYDYDMMERESRKIAKMLGFRADEWEGPTPEEVGHVHWMVDFDENHPFAAEIIEQVEKQINEKKEKK